MTLPPHYRLHAFADAPWSEIDNAAKIPAINRHALYLKTIHYLLHFDDLGEVEDIWPWVGIPDPKHFNRPRDNVTLLLNVRTQSDFDKWPDCEPLRGLCKGLGIRGIPHELLDAEFSDWGYESGGPKGWVEDLPDLLLVGADEWEEFRRESFNVVRQNSDPSHVRALIEQGKAAVIETHELD